MQKLLIKEIFHSLQGEGSRAGENSIFIRLANCNLDCWFCDTDWTQGEFKTIEEIELIIKDFNSNWIIWTGGEPTLQLNETIINHFKNLGYKQAIETNGTKKVPEGIDYIVCSPKIPYKILLNNFPNGLNELRIPIDTEVNTLPPLEILPKSEHYYLSPLFLGDYKKRFDLNNDNLQHCIKLIKENPKWKLSIQQHKIWNIQ